MKKLVILFSLILILATACKSNKPYYKTKEGKKKQEKYNKLQYGERKVFHQ